MVIRRRWSAQPILRVLACLAAAACVARADHTPAIKATNPPAPVRDALGEGKYPWYDVRSDSVKPIWPPREWDLDWLDRWLRASKLTWLPSAGNLIALTLAMAALAILVVVLVLFWRQYQPTADNQRAEGWITGRGARIEELPEGLRPTTDDPWSEALRCRARGDYARAVVCLFAHQLLTLDRLRQVRLIPGQTGRQLVRAINDRQLRAWVDPTLRLFEAVYYGHHIPAVEAFEPVWTAALAFEKHVAEGVTS